MLGWNKITQLTSKAGGAVSKVKDFAKDLITVDTEETQENHQNNLNQDFQSAFAQLQKGYGIAQSPREKEKKNQDINKSPQEQSSPINQVQKIELQEIKKQEIEISSYQEIKDLFHKTFQNMYIQEKEEKQDQENVENQVEENNQIDRQQIYEDYSKQLDQILQTMQNNQSDQINKLNDQLQIEQMAVSDIGKQINQFFIQIQRQSAFYERFIQLKQKGQTKDIVGLVEKSLQNTGSEIIQQKQEQQQNKKEQQLLNDNANLQKKIVELQDKANASQNQMKELQSRIKELEKFQQEWDKIKRDYTEEIKQNFNEIENLRMKIKSKDQELIQSAQEVQKVNDLRTAFEQKTEEIYRLEKLLEEWQVENQSLQSELQAAKVQIEAEKDQKEKLIKKYQEEIKKLRTEVSKEDISQLKFLKENNEKLKLNNSQLKLKLEELTIEHESFMKIHTDLQSEATALHNKIRQDQNYLNNMVDKRVITNVLIQYLDSSADFKVRLQILETLSSLLNLSKEEREKINPYGSRQQQQQPQQTSSFRDKFIGFLKNGE